MNDWQDEPTLDRVDEIDPVEADAVVYTAEAESSMDMADAAALLEEPAANAPLATADGERRISGRERWLRELNQAIAHAPEAPTNYVLRGELALATGDYPQAAADFEKALGLASAQVESSNWGAMAQAMQDRAASGLAQTRRRMK